MESPMLFGSRLAAVILSLTLISATEQAFGAEKSAKKYSIGDRVVQKNREFKLRMGKMGTERSVPIDIWRVEKVDGTKLWISAEYLGIVGSTLADQVVSIDRAIAYYSNQIREHPRGAFARVMRAELWLERDELDEAMADCDEAVRIDPQYGAAYETRTDIRLVWQNVDHVMTDCETAIRLDSRSAMAHVRRGTAFALKQAFDKAMIDFDQAIRLDPQQTAGLIARGALWAARAEYDKALTDYTEAIRINPYDSVAYSNRASLWDSKGEPDKAIADCDVAIRLSADNATAYSTRGLAWTRKRDFGKAMADADTAIRLDPALDSAYRLRGCLFIEKKEFDNAVADLDRLIRLEPKVPEYYLFRGRAWFAKEEYDKAIADCTAAIELNRDRLDAYELRANAWARKQDFDKVIADCTAVIRIDPKRVSAYGQRGWAWSCKGEYENAIKDYSEVIRLDPQNTDAHARRVSICREMVSNPNPDATAYLTPIGNHSHETVRGIDRFEVKDERWKIDDFFRAVPFEHPNDVVFENLVLPVVAGLEITASPPIELERAPVGHDKKTAGDSGGPTADVYRDFGETISRMRYTACLVESQKAVLGVSSSHFPVTDAHQHTADASTQSGKAITGDRQGSDTFLGASGIPRTTSEFILRAQAWLGIGEFDKAIADCDAASRLDSGDLRALGLRAWAWLGKKELDKAILDVTRVIEINPPTAAAYKLRGSAWRYKGQFQKALADYTQAVRLDSKDPQAYLMQAEILATCPDGKLRDGKKAVESATNACELKGCAESTYLDVLAAAQAEAGDFAAAVKWQTRAIELRKDRNEKEESGSRLKLYQEKKPYHAAPRKRLVPDA